MRLTPLHFAGARPRRQAAFTMVEIALSLAVVGFALVAILGVLPTGLQVQKDNREETIVNADGAYILEAIRSGNDQLGVLSNAVYFLSLNYKDGSRDVVAADDRGPIALDGQRLVGILGTPKSPQPNGGVSNVVAWLRSINSTAIDKDPGSRDIAFRYQLIAEVQPFVGYPHTLTNLLGTNDLSRLYALERGLHEVRLTFRWPLYRDNPMDSDKARVGTHRRTFRALVGGNQIFYPTNILGFDRLVYYFQPGDYR